MNSVIKWLPLASGFLVLVLSLTVAVLTVSNKNSQLANTNNTSQDIRAKAAEQPASLSLSPASGDFTLTLASTYPVGIVVDSGGKSVDGVDVIINFDPKKVQVVNPQITTSTMFTQFPANKVDNTKGQIVFSGLTFNPKPVSGIMGTFQIKPLVKGEVTLNFDFALGATTDSNIAENGTAKDVLGSVVSARYTFK